LSAPLEDVAIPVTLGPTLELRQEVDVVLVHFLPV
jgi:hypothetical protein